MTRQTWIFFAFFLLLYNFGEITDQLFNWDQLARYTLPDELTALIDQEVVTIRDPSRIQSAVSAYDFRILVAEERVLRTDGFFEFLLRCRVIPGNADHFNIHLFELWLVITELGKFPRSAGGESGGKESQQHFLLAHKILHSDRAATALRQLKIGRLLAELRCIVGAGHLQLRIAGNRHRQHNEWQEPIDSLFPLATPSSVV